jgi:hypothetical protein
MQQTMNFDMEDSTFLNTATSTLVSYTFFPVTPSNTVSGRKEVLTTVDLNGIVGNGDADEQLGPKVKSPRRKLNLAISTSLEDKDDTNKASKAVDLGRRALIDCGAMVTLQQNLRKLVNCLNYEEKATANETKHAIMVMRWIDELLRFLAIKTLTGDVTVPARMPPSNPIDEAWRCLMIMPSAYSKVCFAMGNETVIDRDSQPRSSNDTTDVQRYKMRFLSTLRTYCQMFKTEPPHVFWPDPTIPNNPLLEVASSAFNFSVQMFNRVVTQSSAVYNKLSSGDENAVIIPKRLKRVIQACTAPESTTPRASAFENVQFQGQLSHNYENAQFHGFQSTRR